jgi:methylase of polypeptide subunit release factors
MLDHSCQVQRRPHAARGLDFYETPAVAVEALLKVETLPHRIWEPAAGRGAIVNVLREHGHDVVASDIADHGFPLRFRRDFLLETEAPRGVDAVITNPPFRLAEAVYGRSSRRSDRRRIPDRKEDRARR